MVDAACQTAVVITPNETDAIVLFAFRLFFLQVKHFINVHLPE